MIERVQPKRKRLVVNQRVQLIYNHRKGTIVAAGPEQSEVKWDDGWPQTIYINKDLEPINK